LTGWTNDDAEFAELRQWLTDAGFVVLADRLSLDTFGDQEVILARPIGLRLVRDRGQWSVEVCGDDGQWRPLARWAELLTGDRARDYSATAEIERLRMLLPQIERTPQAADND
jgi:hypothetical protein